MGDILKVAGAVVIIGVVTFAVLLAITLRIYFDEADHD